RDPEHRDGRLAGRLESRRPARRRDRLRERVERPAQEPRLLAGDDDARRRIGEAAGEYLGLRMTVRAVGDRERPRQLAPVDRARFAFGERAGVEETERRQEVAIATGQERGGERRQQPGRLQIDAQEVSWASNR